MNLQNAAHKIPPVKIVHGIISAFKNLWILYRSSQNFYILHYKYFQIKIEKDGKKNLAKFIKVDFDGVRSLQSSFFIDDTPEIPPLILTKIMFFSMEKIFY